MNTCLTPNKEQCSRLSKDASKAVELPTATDRRH